MQTTRSTVRDDILRAVGDAVWAPSVHNTQPWRFGVAGTRISLRADPDRRLDVADPDGREMLISCGAALYTLRLSLRALGYAPVVTVLPDPARPHLLADVDLEPGEPADRQTLLAHAQIARRRSHRGGFPADPVPPEVVAAMRYDAGHEGARLIEAVDPHVTNALAALTDAAEHVQRRSPAYAAEIARWAPSPRTSRQDGVQERAYPRTVPQTTPNFPARDFARGHGWGVRSAPEAEAPGVVLLLVTGADTPADWLRAGQALQRVLLRATESGLSVALHSQAFEVPELREFIRARFCAGGHPQLLLRLGVAGAEALGTVRRPVEEVVTEES
ncbi:MULTISPECIES: Acg family FMN-binding oxidoreductase [Actinomadura]|uniref:Nitroreductase family protein n=1 Tax=Actinomadura madurae TaxID=1993 RepID=A0A1I5L436_9ACTN|nr:hypothetical protein [Actinomadura madurae]SFO92079.1 hypothetical protein SAMN04489713_110245 [Actinomadura madurae]SPT49398.1 Putative NAD(P)H nitroreductase RV3131/MT3217 [Actinomadura madurae]